MKFEDAMKILRAGGAITHHAMSADEGRYVLAGETLKYSDAKYPMGIAPMALHGALLREDWEEYVDPTVVARAIKLGEIWFGEFDSARCTGSTWNKLVAMARLP